MATWPSDEELSKLSDEHKAMLAQKCVDLLVRKSAMEEAVAEVCDYVYTDKGHLCVKDAFRCTNLHVYSGNMFLPLKENDLPIMDKNLMICSRFHRNYVD